MSLNFPQLFRRSTFASFDPSISRIYTSTPHSVYQHGDWGTKYPIHRQKGPKHITVTDLDAGQLLGSNWRSGETEARFMKAWGNGRVGWMTDSDMPRYKIRSEGNLYDDEFPAPEEKKEEERELMDDVNVMPIETFKSYLKEVRQYRKDFLAGKINSLAPQTRDQLVLPEDKTLVNLGAKGHVANADTAVFQVGLAQSHLKRKGSKRLLSAPHQLHGLSYSRLPQTASAVNHVLHHPGRAVDRHHNLSHLSPSSLRGPGGRGTNQPWVVSTGGVTAVAKNDGARTSESAQIADGVDFTRSNPNQGSARFRVTLARMKSPPQVFRVPERIAAQAADPRARLQTRPTPLSTFKFDIGLKYVPESTGDEVAGLGTRRWVATAPPTAQSMLNQHGDQLGAGGPRSTRRSGQAVKEVRKWEARDASANRAIELLEQINAKRRQSSSSSNP